MSQREWLLVGEPLAVMTSLAAAASRFAGRSDIIIYFDDGACIVDEMVPQDPTRAGRGVNHARREGADLDTKSESPNRQLGNCIGCGHGRDRHTRGGCCFPGCACPRDEHSLIRSK